MTQHEKYQRALDSFTEQVKYDPNVIALLLVGSLSYGTVWERSDIDLMVIARDQSLGSAVDYTTDEDGVEFHITFMELSPFKTRLQKNRAGDMLHGLYGKGNFIFSKDQSLVELFEEARKLGRDDAALVFFGMVGWLLCNAYRAEKWITVFDDPLYAQRFVRDCGMTVGDMVVLAHGEIPTRESVLRAMELEPALMQAVYVMPSTMAMTAADVRRTLQVMDDFLMAHIDFWSKPVMKFLSDGEERKLSHIVRHFSVGDAFPLNYLTEKGLIERFTMPSKVFKSSKLMIEEVAYICPQS